MVGPINALDPLAAINAGNANNFFGGGTLNNVPIGQPLRPGIDQYLMANGQASGAIPYNGAQFQAAPGFAGGMAWGGNQPGLDAFNAQQNAATQNTATPVTASTNPQQLALLQYALQQNGFGSNDQLGQAIQNSGAGTSLSQGAGGGSAMGNFSDPQVSHIVGMLMSGQTPQQIQAAFAAAGQSVDPSKISTFSNLIQQYKIQAPNGAQGFGGQPQVGNATPGTTPTLPGTTGTNSDIAFQNQLRQTAMDSQVTNPNGANTWGIQNGTAANLAGAFGGGVISPSVPPPGTAISSDPNQYQGSPTSGVTNPTPTVASSPTTPTATTPNYFGGAISSPTTTTPTTSTPANTATPTATPPPAPGATPTPSTAPVPGSSDWTKMLGF
jgi:hypothetical protein